MNLTELQNKINLQTNSYQCGELYKVMNLKHNPNSGDVYECPEVLQIGLKVHFNYRFE